jgi:hypothetical protein
MTERLKAELKDLEHEAGRAKMNWWRQKTKAKGLKTQLEESEADLRKCQELLIDAKARLLASIRNGEENAKLAELFRSHLDDCATDMECDNEWEQEARQITWNEVDNNASRRIHCEAESMEQAAMDQAMADMEGIGE